MAGSYNGPRTPRRYAGLPARLGDQAGRRLGPAYIGESKAFTIRVISDGASTAYNIGGNDVLPPNWIYDPGSGVVSRRRWAGDRARPRRRDRGRRTDADLAQPERPRRRPAGRAELHRHAAARGRRQPRCRLDGRPHEHRHGDGRGRHRRHPQREPEATPVRRRRRRSASTPPIWRSTSPTRATRSPGSRSTGTSWSPTTDRTPRPDPSRSSTTCRRESDRPPPPGPAGSAA